MAKRGKAGRGAAFDRETLRLIILVFVVGIAAGFWFGRRSVMAPKIVREKPTREAMPLEEKRKPFAFPFLKGAKPHGAPKLVIVVDDVGNDDHLKDLLWSFPHSVTLAVIPRLPYSEYFSKEGKKRKFEIILHQPMEPLQPINQKDATMIKVGMPDDEIEKILDQNLKSVSSAVGINNHMGSRATQDRKVMRAVLSELKKRRLFFLDSLTTSRSVGRDEAGLVGTPFLERTVFLDNELEPDYIHSQIEHLAQSARKNGAAIGICHYKWNTLTVLRDALSELKSQGFEIVTLKDLL